MQIARHFYTYLDKQLVELICAPTSTAIEQLLEGIEEKARQYNQHISSPYKLFAMGFQCLKKAQFEEALSHFSQATERLTQHTQLTTLQYYIDYGVGLTFLRLGNYGEAISTLTKAMECTVYGCLPLSARVFSNLGLIFIYLKDYSQAHYYLDKAYQLQSTAKEITSSPTLTNLAYVHVLLGKYKEAQKYYAIYEESLLTAPNIMGEYFFYNSFGSFEEIQERPDIALSYYAHAVYLSKVLNDEYYQLDALQEYCRCALICDRASDLIPYINEAIGLSSRCGTVKTIQFFSETLIELSQQTSDKDIKCDLLKQAYDLQGQALLIQSNNNVESTVHLYRLHTERPELENARLLEKNLELVTSFGEYLNSHSSLEEIVNKLYQDLKQIMPIECLSVGLYSSETKQLQYDHFLDLGKLLPPFSVDCDKEDTLSTYCIENKIPFMHGNFSAEVLNTLIGRKTVNAFVGTTDESFPSIMMLPLMLDGHVIGVLSVQTFTVHAYKDYHFSLVKQLCSYLAIDICNKKQKQQLIEQQHELNRLLNIDPLTGLFNRKSLFSSVEQYHKNMTDSMTILFVDIDYYKQFNDTYGHIKGDDVLVNLSSLLLSHFSGEHDKVFRYGGDEFLVLLDGGDFDSVLTKVYAFQQHIKSLAILNESSLCAECITLSIGGQFFSSSTRQDENVNMLIHKADEALYQVKKQGRNGILLKR